VVFIGIDRVVPHSEKSISKSYRSAFEKSIHGCEESVLLAVGRILGSKYSDFHFKSYYKYRLPVVQRNDVTYSGFNMGAGENALFEILYTLHVCPEGALVIVDEIELGLHQEAQKRLMSELKEICLLRKIQMICTTHSGGIMSAVPPDGRFLLESNQVTSSIIPGITADYAAGIMAGSNSDELTIYVEDQVAVDLIASVLDKNTRSRVSIIPIGSDAAIISLMAGLRKEGKRTGVIGILDGDKRKNLESKFALFCKRLESVEKRQPEIEWIKDRIYTLPGDEWPESWILANLKSCLDSALLDLFGTIEADLIELIVKAESAGKHNEFYALSRGLYRDYSYVRKVISAHVANRCKSQFVEIQEGIARMLAA
jgi:hypothetical protein